MFNPHGDSLTLAVVGRGVMGQDIAQISAQAGVAVRLYDSFDNVVCGQTGFRLGPFELVGLDVSVPVIGTGQDIAMVLERME